MAEEGIREPQLSGEFEAWRAAGQVRFTLSKIDRWRRMATAIARIANPAIALSHYWAVEKRFAPLERDVVEVVWRYDDEINMRIHDRHWPGGAALPVPNASRVRWCIPVTHRVGATTMYRSMTRASATPRCPAAGSSRHQRRTATRCRLTSSCAGLGFMAAMSHPPQWVEPPHHFRIREEMGIPFHRAPSAVRLYVPAILC